MSYEFMLDEHFDLYVDVQFQPHSGAPYRKTRVVLERLNLPPTSPNEVQWTEDNNRRFYVQNLSVGGPRRYIVRAYYYGNPNNNPGKWLDSKTEVWTDQPQRTILGVESADPSKDDAVITIVRRDARTNPMPTLL